MTAAGVVDPTSSGNEVSVELSLTQRSDPPLFHEISKHTNTSCINRRTYTKKSDALAATEPPAIPSMG
jgi:hypothetical protein